MSGNKGLLGVIGGMGPLATHKFYQMVIEKTDAACDQEHVDMIILNHATIPDRTKLIAEGKTDELLEILLKDARMLEANGATAISIPCNTSHVILQDLQTGVGIPILNMVEETAEEIAGSFECQDLKIGILATDGTIQTKLYQKALEKRGITPVIPSPETQKLVMKIIYDGVKKGGEIDFSDFLKIQEEMVDKNCQGAIMACTELSCFKSIYNLPDYYIDAMNVLAKRAIIACGRKIKE